MINISRFWALFVCVIAWVSPPIFAAETSVSSKQVTKKVLSGQAMLTQLIEQAINDDASRKQYFAQSQAVRELGIASSTLMDPKLKVGIGGLPVNTFSLDTDPMSNISVALMQEFERGSTLALQEVKANQQADGMQFQIEARELEIASSMTQLWLELGYQQQANEIIIENQNLLRELARFIQTNYAIGKNEAQDLLNAQLQISKLDETLQGNAQIQQRITSQFSQWLGITWLTNQSVLSATNRLNWERLANALASGQGVDYYAQLNHHPLVKMTDAAIAANQTQVNIAEQAYLPKFGVEVMYAYRQANGMNGEPAPDLLSAYLTLDIPLFTGKKQDRTFAATQYQVGAAKSQKDLLLAQLNANVNALLVEKNNVEQRLERYQSTLLTQAKSRTEAVERGYQNNTSQFNDVIAATRDELSLQLEQQRLLTDLHIVNSKLASLLGGYEYTRNQPNIAPLSKVETP